MNYFKLIYIRRKINNEVILYYIFDILLSLNIFFIYFFLLMFFLEVKIKKNLGINIHKFFWNLYFYIKKKLSINFILNLK